MIVRSPMIACLFGALLCSAAEPARAADPELIVLDQRGATTARINLVLLAEGYQQGTRDKFVQDARVVLEGMLGAEPAKSYRDHFNAFGIFVESVDPGCDHPSQGIVRNTYFNSSFDSFGLERLLTIPPNNFDANFADGQGKVIALLKQYVPEYDLSAVVVNDLEYGGSGGPVLVVSTHAASAEVAVHEMGHSFAHLGDEYGDAYPGYPDVEEPNTTKETRRDFIKWKSWIDPATPVPTPESDAGYEDAIGLFEGAHYHETGWYRPKDQCKMRYLGIPFCSVCAEAIVLSTYRLTSPVDSFSPDDTDPLSVSQPRSFDLNLVPLAVETRQVDWTLNKLPIAAPGMVSVRLAAWGLPQESNELVATITDTTPLVRSDVDGLLHRSITWTLLRGTVTAPELEAIPSGDHMLLSWDSAAYDFILESGESPSGADGWTAVESKPNYDGARLWLRLDVQERAQFFRLHLP